MAAIRSDFSDVVRFHRRQAGLSRAELGRLAGVGKTTLYDIEHGKTTIRLNSLTKVLWALNISLDWSSPLKEEYETSTHSHA